MSALFHIFMCAFCLLSYCNVLPMLSLLSLAVLLKVPLSFEELDPVGIKIYKWGTCNNYCRIEKKFQSPMSWSNQNCMKALLGQATWYWYMNE